MNRLAHKGSAVIVKLLMFSITNHSIDQDNLEWKKAGLKLNGRLPLGYEEVDERL